MKHIKFVELKPDTSQKSFNGKAMVELSYGCAILYSYNTRIARINRKGEFEKLWSGYSATTMKHIKAFCALYDVPCGGKSWWLELPVTKIDIMREWNVKLDEKS